MDLRPSKKNIHNFILQFAFGGLGAIISKTIASPIEVVKLRLQVQYALVERGILSKQYEGILDCFKRLYIEDGIIAFYKGNGTNVLRFFLTQALNFSFRDLFRNIQGDKKGIPKQNLSFLSNIISGGIAGATTQLLVYPLDYTRTRLANQISENSSVQFRGMIHCITQTLKLDGIKGIYRGVTISCICMVLYRGLYFGIYDTFRPYISKKNEQNMLFTFSLGYIAAITSGALSYPLDTVRRRMMMTSGQLHKFSGAMECMKKIYSEGGSRAFFRGGAANVVGGITGAAVLSIYDKIKISYQHKYG